MYLFFGILFLILLFFFCINHWRRKKIIRKVCAMCMNEKCELLDELLSPFGYAYVPSQDIFTSRIDAWQRDLGYCALYDKAASRLNMVFDSLPVYFDYQNRTWMIEFWKGQYGINTGCEIGVYYADRILEEKEYKHTLFQCVSKEDMPKLSFTFYRKEQTIAKLCARHWWLTAFKTGCFSSPADLCLHACVAFPNREMARAFAAGLMNAGYDPEDICVCAQTVSFHFGRCKSPCGFFHRLRIRLAQCLNRFWCRVYCYVTRPFCLSVDRILYLYFYLPAVFRKTLRIRKYKRRWRKKH